MASLHQDPRSERAARSPVVFASGDLGTCAAFTVAFEAELDVRATVSTAAAITLLFDRRPALLIVDTEGPEPLGLLLESAARLRVPVIALHAPEAVDALKQLADFALDAVVVKPCQAHELGDRIRKTLGAGPRAPAVPGSPVVSRLVSLVAAHYHEPLTLSTAARALGVTPGRLSALARRELDKSVGQFTLAVRVEAVKTLLLTGDAPLAAVAAQVGFVDASHLSRVFVRRVGCRPGEFRRSRFA